MTHDDLRMAYPVVARMDGRIEITCRHGIGHTSHKLTMQAGRMSEERYYGVHGCDGCCGQEEYVAAEVAHFEHRAAGAKVDDPMSPEPETLFGLPVLARIMAERGDETAGMHRAPKILQDQGWSGEGHQVAVDLAAELRGQLLAREVDRLSRKPWFYFSRTAVLILCALVIAVGGLRFWQLGGGVTFAQRSEMGIWLFHALHYCTVVALLVIVPAVLGGALAGERQAGTAEVLYAAPLSSAGARTHCCRG